MTAPAAPTATAPAPAAGMAPADLAEVLQAYSAVAERLQASHEALSSEVERLQAELVRKNEQLERGKRLAALGEMAAGIAHEIRNPLAAIQLYVEMIREDVAAANLDTDIPDDRLTAAGENGGRIADAVRGLSAIVNDVLSFSQTFEPQLRPVPAADLLNRVAEAQQPVLDAAGVRLRLAPGHGVLPVDPSLLHRALLNLVRNAAEALAEHGTADPVVTLTAGPGEIVVRDNGPGIDPAAVERLFNPFFTTRGSGTGLGLAIVHRIVDAHGGSIAVRNDGGAVFTLRFTADLCPEPEPAAATAAHPAPVPTS